MIEGLPCVVTASPPLTRPARGRMMPGRNKYVALNGCDAAEAERTYPRLKRQRTRLKQRLRTQAVDAVTQPSGGC